VVPRLNLKVDFDINQFEDFSVLCHSFIIVLKKNILFLANE
jgi:hypothetical protein